MLGIEVMENQHQRHSYLGSLGFCHVRRPSFQGSDRCCCHCLRLNFYLRQLVHLRPNLPNFQCLVCVSIQQAFLYLIIHEMFTFSYD